MGKKRRKAPKVWCYYCEREFDDEKVLVQHQKAKHFKCHYCHKKLSTAGGMAIHVLQVHKETVTKVPNAKPDRESTEIEIYGMEGIPPEILAAHDEDYEEGKATKSTKAEAPPSGFGGISLPTSAIHMPSQPLYPAIPPMHTPQVSVPHRPPNWPATPPSQAWSASPISGQSPIPFRPAQLPQMPQPLFPIPNPPVPVTSSVTQPFQDPLLQRQTQPIPRPLFPVQNNQSLPLTSSGLPSQSPVQSSYSPVPSSYSTQSHSLFPINGQYTNTPLSSNLSSPFPSEPLQRPTSEPIGPVEGSNVSSVHSAPTIKGGSAPEFSGALATSTSSHMYALGPNTGAPSIGPPPVISNKPPSAQAAAKEVYLVWDDEAMSMEERRMGLGKYQVYDETSQVSP
eukprot:TRINITY_DN19835_c1_g1_i1.p1 TRINITY_DN19835_c1_g1~~TRINITY_DN19835_c1_g1_i1.p1  ORF type:complete len:396 (-),score=80.85 TRINITY_DN19835_c1_g1_i1:299-1486(-)